jgi:hypothetical protein
MKCHQNGRISRRQNLCTAGKLNEKLVVNIRSLADILVYEMLFLSSDTRPAALCSGMQKISFHVAHPGRTGAPQAEGAVANRRPPDASNRETLRPNRKSPAGVPGHAG